MELHTSTNPVKSKYMNPKPTRKISQAPKIKPKTGQSIPSRVFGTARNPNIPSKTAPKAKPTVSPPPPIAEAKDSSHEKKPKKKSVCFLENENTDVAEPQTPLPVKSTAKPRRSLTPYHSAEKCSKCRFDKLETAAYWLGQIKLAESVKKHSVSAAFFQLAFDCKAEPIRNIRVELKKYVGRHEHLDGKAEWKKLSNSYGLVKEIRSVKTSENASVEDEEDKDLQKEIEA